MTVLLSIDNKILQKISSFFELGIIVSCEKIPQGMNNPSFLVCNTKGGKFVIRILEKQTLDGVKNERFIQQQLINIGIKCPVMLNGNDNNYFYCKSNIKATVSKKIEGYHANSVSEILCKRIGEELAGFHMGVSDTVLPTSHKGWLNIASAEKNLSGLSNNEHYKNLGSTINKAKRIFNKNLPEGIIHGDFIIENILFNANDTIAAILDFDESEENILLLDIAKTIVGVCIKDGQINKQFSRAFLAGYNKVRKITKEENENLSMAFVYVINVCAAWFIKNGYIESANLYLNIRLSS